MELYNKFYLYLIIINSFEILLLRISRLRQLDIKLLLFPQLFIQELH